MSLEARLLLGLALAVSLVYWTTPLAIRIADRFEFYDHPVGYKGHGRPTPYLGGLAVVGGFAAVLLVLGTDWGRTLPLLGGVAVLWAVGTLDDRRTVTPGIRVTVEIGLAAALFAAGLGWDLGGGAFLNLLVTAVWVVAVVNAFNLFDNMDGAASSMGAVVAAGLALLGAVQGDAWLAVAAAALSGACAGFLPHNLLRSPARIFLGDGGSMPVGFAIAALTMIGASGARAEWQSLAMGVMFIGVPALDTALVVISRRRRGISILTGGRDHLTHRTRERVRTARAVAITLGAAQALVSALALVAIEGGSFAVVAAVAAYAVAVGAAITVLDAGYEHASAPGAVASAGRGRAVEAALPALLVPIAIVAGLCPFAFGYYDSSIWVPAGLALVPLVTAAALAWPARLSRPAWLVLGGLAGLALLSLLSGLWADSVQQAVFEANRLLVYAVALGGLFLVLRSDRAALWLLGAFSATAAIVAGVVIVRMLGSDPAALFVGGRLDRPLGYINGQASFFLLALWPCLAAAEQRRSALLAGAGLAGATAFAGLAALSQSRGVAMAMLVTLTVVLAVVPGRLRRAWAFVLLGCALAAAGPSLLAVFDSQVEGRVAAGAVREAAVALLAASIAAGVLWGGAVAAVRSESARRTARTVAVAALALVAVAGLGIAAANAGRIADTVSEQYRIFVHAPIEPQGTGVDATGRSRLLTGSGNRYDYWRVAWSSFREHPLGGVGAGGFDSEWFAKRRSTEDVRQAHSIELQALGELGIAGAGLLALLLGAVGWGAWRTSRAATASPAAAAVAVAGTGVFTAWLVHTSVDWMHLIPGLTLVALAAMVALVRRPRGEPRAAAGLRVPRLVVPVAVALVLTTAGLSLVRQALAEHYESAARSAMPGDPSEAIRQADRSLRLDAESVPAYYVKAAAFARLGEGDAARQTLLEAARREPRDFVTWALLGDLAVRIGDEQSARSNYGRALRLNPRDAGLRAQLAELDN